MDLLTRLRTKKILLVDDDEWIRDSMGAFFDSEGCFFKAVESAEAGIDALREKQYDIIIADYRLPGMDGLAFFDRIRRSHTASLKILITAHGDRTLAERSAAAGVDDYIAKPFQMQDIETSLTRLMNGRSK
ncbi:response regulator [Breoghania sp.]|uniref:response regulator n=1 Tax=Breoghania sp. TaxID=2065378 RepID=UPI0029C65386|nr:response regulator [Breoghania sp.]